MTDTNMDLHAEMCDQVTAASDAMKRAFGIAGMLTSNMGNRAANGYYLSESQTAELHRLRDLMERLDRYAELLDQEARTHKHQ